MSIVFKNIDIQTNGVKILKNVSGKFVKDKVNIIMGPSGAGKTTLLNSLLFYNNSNYKFQGEIFYEGQNLTKEIVRKSIGYVTQTDNLIPYLTVFETIYWSIKLRYNIPENNIISKVMDLIRLLDLENCSDTRVGNSDKKGISGGEKKRVCIALELTSPLDVLVLDEPTSGLDAYSALSVMNILQSLTRTGITVICTIHQPSSEISALFQYLTLMCQGQIVYNGVYAYSIQYFNDLMVKNRMDQLDSESNPVDVYMRWLYVGLVEDEEDKIQEKRANIIQKSWKDIDVKNKKALMQSYNNAGVLYKYEDQRQINFNKFDLNIDKNANLNPIIKIAMVFQYCVILELKNWIVLMAKLAQNISIALVYLAFYYRFNNLSISSFVDRSGLFFLLITNGLFGNMIPTVQMLFKDKPIIIKETKRSMYMAWQYLLCKNIVNLFFDAIILAIMVAIMYNPLGLNQEDGFTNILNLYIICFLTNQFAISLGQLLSIFGDDITQVQPQLQIIAQPLILTSGVFADLSSLWFVFAYIKYINPLSYTYSAFLTNELQDNQLCTDEMIMVQSYCTKSGLGIMTFTIENDMIALLSIALFWRILSFILFEYHISRKNIY